MNESFEKKKFDTYGVKFKAGSKPVSKKLTNGRIHTSLPLGYVNGVPLSVNQLGVINGSYKKSE